MPETDLISPSPPRFTSLRDIQEEVAPEMDTFQTYFREAMRTDVGLLGKVVRYVLRQKGKRIRPTLVLLSA